MELQAILTKHDCYFFNCIDKFSYFGIFSKQREYFSVI
jgi:hypothetical protein